MLQLGIMILPNPIQENIPLKPFTTLKVGGSARYFAKLNLVEDLPTLISFANDQNLPIFVLGGGSNIVVSDHGFPGLVIAVQLKGIECVNETKEGISFRVAAGEPWDPIVEKMVAGGKWGLENLSLIPGLTGSVAIQNVGAYGQESSHVIESVDVFEIPTGQRRLLSVSQCQFSYRTSIFNTTGRNRYIILGITFSLSKKALPILHYEDLIRFFKGANIQKPSLSEIRHAVITIRNRKLPNPNVVGNVGSFFKNLTLTPQEFETLIAIASPHFDTPAMNHLLKSKPGQSSGTVKTKVSSAFLIESCGLKGVRLGGAQVSPQHALVITNASGTATAQDILSLAKRVLSTVEEKTGLRLPLEPQWVGFSSEELGDLYSR